MAYAAVISLKLTIERLQSCRHIQLRPLRQVMFAYGEVMSLGERVVNRRLKALDAEIRAAVWRLEDALESHLSNQVLSQSEERSHRDDDDDDDEYVVLINLDEVQQEINSFAETIKKVKDDYAASSRTDDDDDDDDGDDDDDSSRVDFGGKMIGLSDELSTIRNELTAKWPSKDGCLARGDGWHRQDDPLISNYFDSRAWVAVDLKYGLDRIVRCIIAQANPDIDEIHGESDVKLLGECLYKSLAGKRYLIVLDGQRPVYE